MTLQRGTHEAKASMTWGTRAETVRRLKRTERSRKLRTKSTYSGFPICRG